MAEQSPTSRRDFLAASAKMAAAAGLVGTTAYAARQSGADLKVAAGPAPKPIPAGQAIRLGLIGTGGRGQQLLIRTLELPNVEVKALADPFEPHAQKAREKIKEKTGKAPDVYTGADDYKNKLLGREDIDAIVSATPCNLHGVMYLACFAAGKHFYGEKPMCITVPEANALVAAQKKNPQIVAQIGFQRRAGLVYQESMKRLRAGQIGEPIAGYGAWNNAWGPLGLPGPDTTVWFGRRKQSGDWMLEQACHTWDAFNWVAGDMPIAASGVGKKGIFKDVDPERDVTDFYNAHLVWKCGMILDFEHNWFLPKTDPERVFSGTFERVVGPKGGIDLAAGKFMPREDKGQVQEWGKAPHDDNADAIKAFLNSIRTQTPPVSGVENGRWATIAGLMVRKAVDERRWVNREEILAEG